MKNKTKAAIAAVMFFLLLTVLCFAALYQLKIDNFFVGMLLGVSSGYLSVNMYDRLLDWFERKEQNDEEHQ